MIVVKLNPSKEQATVDKCTDETPCYTNEIFAEKRLKTRTIPYKYTNENTNKDQESFDEQLDAIDVSQIQCLTDETLEAWKENGTSPCGPYQECLFSQRGDIGKGKWGCYDSKCKNWVLRSGLRKPFKTGCFNYYLSAECGFDIPFRFGQIYDLEDTNGTIKTRDDDGFSVPGASEECCYTREFWNGEEWTCRQGSISHYFTSSS